MDSPVEVTLSCHDQESLDEGEEPEGNSFEQLEVDGRKTCCPNVEMCC